MPPHGPLPDRPVRVPVMRHRWEALTFLHWSYPVEQVQRHLPPPLRVEAWEGRAWVGLVPFRMRLRGPVGPELAGISPFPETNVRTYVTGPDGRPGVWFFSLDAGSRAAVVAARVGWRLPYFYGDMAIEEDGSSVRYRAHRRWPGPAGIRSTVGVSPGRDIPEPSEFEHFLTARFALWNVIAGIPVRTQARHPPWVLRRARVDRLEDGLVPATGLPAPTGEPLVHFSAGVDVEIGGPRPVLRRGRDAPR